ncbi:MAG: glucosamine 6-phosphate synthetase [Bacteroidota bacterium]|nr:glucosamine 6-phosphate synthetase [Bacteroidota bacterium]MDP3146154.1 glucosamine 6-phosphate synthetase [Bacteroidota bacterium]
MCGIFGIIASEAVDKKDLKLLAKHAQQRGKDSSGLIFIKDDKYQIYRADYNIDKLLNKIKPYHSSIVLGHSRLITNGLSDNQPVIRDDIFVLHNGIIINDEEIWKTLKIERKYQIDSEVIAGIALEHFKNGSSITDLADVIMKKCIGVVSCAILIQNIGKILLISNNGSLYTGLKEGATYFASEKYALTEIGCADISQIHQSFKIIDVPVLKNLKWNLNDFKVRTENLIPEFNYNKTQEALLQYKKLHLKRCTKCILPETMPYIRFNEEGVCNYCLNYKLRNTPKPKEELFKIVEPYRKKNGLECIVPFSGGRDSCYGLHLIVKELKLRPVTYTYDWGMVTDLGRRNISRMCAELGVENIIVAADISLKRKNIRMNLEAWLKSPNLGMMAMLTAGDKHFFRYAEEMKKQTGVDLNLWGINPLEVTHFKTGFLGIKPDFEEDRVYSHGVMKQLRYHFKRFKAMTNSPGYFNSSLWDTLSGEYYRSFTKKKDYFHIFDYWRWDEQLVNSVLINDYGWELAVDTNTTWRIGDGTAAFYNYVYYTVAGFTEHDTFRSNQIREGQITREKALELVEDENQPRYQNIRWYLDTLGMDFERVIKIVNNIEKLYKE